MRLDHVAILVPTLEPALERLRGLDDTLAPGPIERFPGEGTREVYLDRPGALAARLLLVEPAGDGPYARALARRGPGLHHVAFQVADARAFALGRAGWLLHPRSLDTFARGRTLWLARPGVGVLVEVQELEVPGPDGPPLVARVEVPGEASLVAALGSDLVRASSDGEAWLDLGRGRVRVNELTG